MPQAVSDVWLSVPKAILLLWTGDLARVRELTEADPVLLVYRVARALSSKPIIVPLNTSATEAQQVEAWQIAKKRLAAEAEGTNLYSAALIALVDILATRRARARGSRTPDGPIEPIDQAEFTRLRVVHVDAVNERTKAVAWYDLRVSAGDLLELRQWVEAEASHPSAGDDMGVLADDRPRGRLGYLGFLEHFVAGLGDKFNGMSDSGVARRFMDQCTALAKAGKSAPKLPSDRRRIEVQVKKIRAQRFAVASNRAIATPSNNA